MTTKQNIKISSGVVKGIKMHQCILQNKKYAAVGILASSKNNTTIDNVYFIKHRQGGCSYMPRLYANNVAQEICKVIKAKKDIRGLVLILADNLSEDMYSEFRRMICSKGWDNNKFVYAVCGRHRLKYYKSKGYSEQFSKIPLKEVN